MEARDFKFAKGAVWALLISTAALTFAGVLSLFGTVFPTVILPVKVLCIFAFGAIFDTWRTSSIDAAMSAMDSLAEEIWRDCAPLALASAPRWPTLSSWTPAAL